MKHKIFLNILLISLIWILPFQALASNIPVRGHAWSENIGWIKFDHGAPSGQVQLDDTTGIFSGYAWSENIGWITFNESELAGCPSGTCQAKLDLGTKEVSGWARALAYGGGWDGWIKLRGSNYGVSLNTTPDPAEFQGYAWSDMVVGWISFNCSNQGVCGISNYKVVVGLTAEDHTPRAEGLGVEISSDTVCAYTSGARIRLLWTFMDDDPGDTQSAYQIQITKVSDGSVAINTGKVSSDSHEFVNNPPGYSLLGWDTSYNWQLKVWDSTDTESSWASGPSFTTPQHSYPSVDFSWAPSLPGANEEVTFTDLSTVYGGATKAAWLWVFNPDGIPATSSQQNPKVKFLTTGQKQVSLSVTDSDGFTCPRSKLMNIKLPLPEWKEIPPFSWINKLFASLSKLLNKL